MDERIKDILLDCISLRPFDVLRELEFRIISLEYEMIHRFLHWIHTVEIELTKDNLDESWSTYTNRHYATSRSH